MSSIRGAGNALVAGRTVPVTEREVPFVVPQGHIVGSWWRVSGDLEVLGAEQTVVQHLFVRRPGVPDDAGESRRPVNCEQLSDSRDSDVLRSKWADRSRTPPDPTRTDKRRPLGASAGTACAVTNGLIANVLLPIDALDHRAA